VGVHIRVFPCFLFVWYYYIGVIFYNFFIVLGLVAINCSKLVIVYEVIYFVFVLFLCKYN
jgi:hypothetical protein